MRWIVGYLLVTAAILKAAQLVTEPTAALLAVRASPDPVVHGSPDPALIATMLPPLQVGAELAIGLFALSGYYWRQLRWFAFVLFIGFAAYSFHLATTGATSCGCFGPLRVHPWWTFGLDLAVVVGLFSSLLAPTRVPRLAANRLMTSERDRLPNDSARNPEESKQCGRELKHPLSFQRTLVAAAMGISIFTTALLARHLVAPTAAAEGVLQMAGDLIVLEPEKWVGKPLPIAEFVDLDLSTGEWTVLLHRHDCPDCEEAVPKYEQLATTGTRVALVEVPPFGELHPGEAACHYARLTDDREWFVQTPVELELRDGIVSAVKTPNH
jgi:hypothetical protein